MGCGGSAGYILTTVLLHFPDSLKSDMQHDHVLKKLNFDLLTNPQGRRGEGLQAKYILLCCCIRDSF